MRWVVLFALCGCVGGGDRCGVAADVACGEYECRAVLGDGRRISTNSQIVKGDVVCRRDVWFRSIIHND